jgi:DNA topoisomerase-6 subunit B
MTRVVWKSAEQLAREQREISVAEFFEKNRHLLGFDNPAKALLTVVKEAVDNALDAACDAGILPKIRIEVREPRQIFRLSLNSAELGEFLVDNGKVTLSLNGEEAKLVSEKANSWIFEAGGKKYRIKKLQAGWAASRGRTELRVTKSPADRYLVMVEDNGPGIVPDHVPRIFGKLLYGSRFFKMAQTRGQQGIGVSAACLYAQLTTGRPAKIWSRTSSKRPVHYFELRIDTSKNEPVVLAHKSMRELPFLPEHGVRLELEIEGRYIQRYHSVEEYLRQTAAANPFAHIIYTGPDNQIIEHRRAVTELPALPRTIRPHPHGVELGMFERMAKATDKRTLLGFLAGDFCRIGQRTAEQLIKLAGLRVRTRPAELSHSQLERLWRSVQSFSFMKPPTNCLSPIGEAKLESGLKKEYGVDFVAAVSRAPAVYRGMPFVIEAAIGYGGQLKPDEIKVVRLANRVPLLYQAASCAITKAMHKINWRAYGLEMAGNSPVGPAVLVVHMASVWIPYVSEAKEAIASYPIIVHEIKLALQEVGRQLGRWLAGKRRREAAAYRTSLFARYIPEVAAALSQISGVREEKIKSGLERILQKGDIIAKEDTTNKKSA